MLSEYKKWIPASAGLAIIGAICLVGWSISSRTAPDLVDIDSGSPALARNRSVDVGGIRRPSSDVKGHVQRSRKTDKPAEQPQQYPYGKTPLVSPESNATTALVYAAMSAEGEVALEKKSPFAVGKKFDVAEYKQDPQSYLEKFEPGRVWQSAQPGPGVPLLGRITSRGQSLRQGESVRLQVKTEPNAPVSYSSFDLGAFQNKLPSITVAADDSGVAEAIFTGTSGTISRVHIVAASPVATGRLAFELNVEPR